MALTNRIATTMATPLSPVIYVHMFAAIAAVVVGGWQLLRPKGTPVHRATGWVWVMLMLVVAISSLWIPSFLQFSWIHLLTLLVLVTLPRAVWHARQGNIEQHRKDMRILYFFALIIAGAFTLLPGRLLGNLVWKGCWGC